MMGGDPGESFQRAEALFERVVGSGARLPGQRRYEARKRALASGISISRTQYDILEALRIP